MDWLIKLVAAKVVDLFQDQLDALPNQIVPPGTIVIWYGLLGTIPDGWQQCNGTNGTPDLRDKFVACAISDVEGLPIISYHTPGAPWWWHTGGTWLHDHGIGTHDAVIHLDDGDEIGPGDTFDSWGKGHKHTVQFDNHVPKFRAQHFIMKLFPE